MTAKLLRLLSLIVIGILAFPTPMVSNEGSRKQEFNPELDLAQTQERALSLIWDRDPMPVYTGKKGVTYYLKIAGPDSEFNFYMRRIEP